MSLSVFRHFKQDALLWDKINSVSIRIYHPMELLSNKEFKKYLQSHPKPMRMIESIVKYYAKRFNKVLICEDDFYIGSNNPWTIMDELAMCVKEDMYDSVLSKMLYAAFTKYGFKYGKDCSESELRGSYAQLGFPAYLIRNYNSSKYCDSTYAYKKIENNNKTLHCELIEYLKNHPHSHKWNEKGFFKITNYIEKSW